MLKEKASVNRKLLSPAQVRAVVYQTEYNTRKKIMSVSKGYSSGLRPFTGLELEKAEIDCKYSLTVL
jgi:hypothetical protein